ncbi:MAG TPA: hypothetical protein G4O11_03255 [Anaerolineae bacterium]|nr:MAG: hypothetical protein AMJ88_18780 [Anaerolineae bacterium SM23_ 63]HEY42981.1 hypothetical protein [Anaerolineae bacterium]
MAEEKQFKRLESKTYLSHHQDGLLDVLIGQIMLGLGFGMASGWIGGLAILGFFPIALYVPLKNRITIPRLGYVEFIPKASREALLKIAYPLFFCTCMVIFLLVARVPEGVTPVAPVWTPSEAWPAFRLWLQGKESLLFGLAMFIVFGVVGMATKIRRLFAYALLGLMIMVGGQLFHLRTFIPLFVMAGITYAVGIIMLIQFLRKYPIMSEENLIGDRDNHASS